MDGSRLDRERADALRRIATLRRQLDGVVAASDWTAHDDEHDPEGATIAFERAQISGLLATARDDLAAIDRAIQRLRAGTYGRCWRCGGEIGRERLEALPAATTCIRCAAR